MWKSKIIGLTAGVLFAASAMAATKHFDIKDNYREVIYLEPYTVEVCSKQQVSAASQEEIANAAFWGAIFGAVVGDVVTEGDGGKLPGAVIGVQSVLIMQLRSQVQLRPRYVRQKHVRSLHQLMNIHTQL